MSSRFSAARPKRTGETFARARHGESDPRDGPSSVKKVKFDVRNPSALAPDSGGGGRGGGDDDYEYDEADEQVLAADVIRSSAGATKRGAVNIDGYDSDSDNENFNARAEAREGRMKKKKGKGKRGKASGAAEDDVDLADQLDNYNASLASGGAAANDAEDDDEEEIDMFGAADDDAAEGDADEEAAGRGKAGRKGKEVRFLKNESIEGQEQTSKSGGTVRLDDGTSSDDDEEAELAIQEQGIDEEVGLGGLKKNAPKIDAFNMRQEQEEGAFDEAGNFIRKATDPDAVHDRWLEGVSKKEIKRAAEAHEKREAERRLQRREDDSILTSDLFKALILRLEKGETSLEALARLGKNKAKPKVRKWKQKKQKNGPEKMDVDTEVAEDPKQTKIREAIDAITEAADRLLRRDYPDIYDTERERLAREYRNETGEDWVDPPKQEEEEDGSGASPTKMWQYRWIDGRDGAASQGPFDGPTMKAWQDAGYFGEGVEFRPAGQEGGWDPVGRFV